MSNATISIQNLSVTYNTGLQALKDISLELTSQKIIGLVGMNGAGKSTLFNTIMGFTPPTQGKISILGAPIKTALKNNKVAYVPQTENIDWNFPILVEDVVMMGRYGHMNWLRIASKQDHNAVDDALKRVDMLKYRKHQIGELSGGQRKRVFVARALAQGGNIMLLDEPFAGVDIKTENALIKLFKTLASEGKCILVSTHNLGTVPQFCDDVILINQSIIAHGAVEDTFTHDHLAATFGDMLRHHTMHGEDIHDDEDQRGLTVITDDERPLVLYGEQTAQKIMKNKKKKSS